MNWDILISSIGVIFSEPSHFGAIFIGVSLGVLVGCLPGLTATTGCALLIPFTFGLPPIQGLLLLIGVFCGGIYGGSISGILIRTPGTPAAAATLLDGFPMAQKGLAGKAIGIATISSFVGGTIGALIMIFLSPTLASFGLQFGPPEFFALTLFGLGMIITVSSDSIIKGFISALIGLLITTIGFDPLSGFPRFTFDNLELLGGLEFIPVLIGLYGFAQVFRNMETLHQGRDPIHKMGAFLPKMAEIIYCLPTMIKSAVMGTFIGSIPGTGTDVAAFAAYGEAKRSSKNSEEFGKGSMLGVAAPEAANNAATGGAMIPMLTLGVPGDAVTAVLLGALTIHGYQPGPVFFSENLDIIYPLFIGFILAQFALLVIGLVGARYFAKLLSVDPRLLTASIFILCIVGSYSMRFNFFDVYLAMIIGIFAYFLERFKFPLAPILLALILGPMAEQNFRRSLMLSQGEYSIFITRPLSLLFICVAVIVVWSAYMKTRKTKN